MTHQVKPSRVFLFDEHLAVREGLRRMFADTSLAIRYEARSPDELFRKLEHARFDVLIMEPRTQGRRDLDLLDTVLEERSGARVLIYSGAERLPFIAKCYRRGALGFVSKVADRAILIAGALAVGRGEQYFAPGVAQQIARYSVSPHRDPALLLDSKLLRIFVELAAGRSTGDIARALGLSEKTVQNLVPRIRMQLGNVQRDAFHDLAVEYGLIEEVRHEAPETHVHTLMRRSRRGELQN